jgi:hypothetical protein
MRNNQPAAPVRVGFLHYAYGFVLRGGLQKGNIAPIFQMYVYLIVKIVEIF